jgi:hypothetical protein
VVGATRRCSRILIAPTGALLLARCIDAGAQTMPTCGARAARPSISAAVAGSVANAYMKRDIIETGFDQEALIRHAVGVSGIGTIPITSRSSVRVELGRAGFGIDRITYRDLNHTDVARTEDMGTVDLTHLTIGIERSVVTGRRLCGFWSGSAGWYRFSHGAARANDAGIVGAFGFEVPFAVSSGLLFEFQANAIGNQSTPPLAAETIVLFRASAGARLRF